MAAPWPSGSVEETAAILLSFATGVLGTVTVSDSVLAPWSWKLTAGEYPAYPRQDESCLQIGGTEGSLTILQLDIWTNPGKRSWLEPLSRLRLPAVPEDPLMLRVRHFCDVIRTGAVSVVSG